MQRIRANIPLKTGHFLNMPETVFKVNQTNATCFPAMQRRFSSSFHNNVDELSRWVWFDCGICGSLISQRTSLKPERRHNLISTWLTNLLCCRRLRCCAATLDNSTHRRCCGLSQLRDGLFSAGSFGRGEQQPVPRGVELIIRRQ